MAAFRGFFKICDYVALSLARSRLPVVRRYLLLTTNEDEHYATNKTASRPVPVLSRTPISQRVISTHRPDRKVFFTKSERNCRTPRRVPQTDTPHDCEKYSLGAVRPHVQCGPVSAHSCTFTHCGRLGTASAPTVQRADNWQQFI
jgi:hypothetical protein